MGFEMILEGLYASPLQNLLPKFTFFNFRKSDIYPGKKQLFPLGYWDRGVLMDFNANFFPSIMSEFEQFIFT